MEPLNVRSRLLCGPGPCNTHAKVLAAMSQPLMGHMDPSFLALMDQIQSGLRALFGTQNPFTLPISATGSAGMEACLVNLLEPGDKIVVGVHGVFGGRMCEVATRAGAQVFRVESPFGKALELEQMVAAITTHKPAVVAFVHAETSTGVLQPHVKEICDAAHSVGALVVMDCVTSLAGCRLEMDAWGVDAVYSGTQKCLAVPPGLSPMSMNARALAKAQNRKTPVQSWYLDVTLLSKYYSTEASKERQRAYHHTAPITLIYGLYEGLRLALEEGLDARIKRHQEASALLLAGLADLGLTPLVAPECRLPQLTTIALPPALQGPEEAKIRARLLNDFNLEIGGGLGELAGKVWRIGLMGENARAEVVATVLASLKAVLPPL